MKSEDITIAITVYSRAQFVFGAIESALNQTMPVKVIVVEDCGPNPELKPSVLKRFGDRIQYFRNAKNRGLFDNWNACLEYSTTPWLSILHDDDLLRPTFVEAMLRLHENAPECSIYFGRSAALAGNKTIPAESVSWPDGWRRLPLPDFAERNLVLFPGQLFNAADAREVGAFRPISLWAGDWDFWFRMAAHRGAAQTAEEVAVVRSHYGSDRGTSRVERMGWKWALDNVQFKRNLALLARKQPGPLKFDRKSVLKDSPVPARYLFRFAHGFSRRMLKYNHWLYVNTPAPHGAYAAAQWFARVIGPRGLRFVSKVWRFLQPLPYQS